MVRAEPTTLCTAGIDTFHLTRFSVLLMLQTQHYIWYKTGYGFQSRIRSFSP